MLVSNFTITSLTSTFLLFHSPFISLSSSSSLTSSFFTNLRISHSFSSFLHISNRLSSKLTLSTFSHFLSSAITTSSVQFLIQKTYVFTRQLFEDQPLSIWNCQFRDFRVFENGGAFSAKYSVDLFNVCFQNATARHGGCFFTTSSVHCVYCTFQQSKGALGGGFAGSAYFAPITIEHSLFAQLDGTASAAFWSGGRGPVCIESTNFTQTRSESHSGAFESNGSASIQFSRFMFTTARTQNGGIRLNLFANVSIRSTVFNHCSHRATVKLAGAAFFAQEVSEGSQIVDCAFVNSQRGQGCTIAVAAGSLLVMRCCFSGERAVELFVSDGTVNDQNCTFNVRCVEDKMPLLMDLGFREGRSPTYMGAASRSRTAVSSTRRPLSRAGQVTIGSLAFIAWILLESLIGVVVKGLFGWAAPKNVRVVL
jgi:hypothetical protein